MKERIIEFLKKENKTASQFAEEINVQPSGISHILSGRNKPSLDFVLKMLEKYPYISSDWLLFGKGEMYRDKSLATLFDNFDQQMYDSMRNEKDTEKHDKNQIVEKQIVAESVHDNMAHQHTAASTSKIRKIVFFYDNGTFEEYLPEGK